MAVIVAELLALLKLDKKKFDKDMKSAEKDLGGLNDRLGKAAGNIRDFGNKMTLATAPIALGLGVAIHQTKEFDSLMTNVNAVLGITGSEAANLRSELLDYGGSTRHGPIAVAEAFYEIAGGVTDASTHMAILEASVRTADAGQANLTATTNALIAAMNSYGFAADDAAMVSDVFTNTVGMGVLSMEELAASMPQVTGLAASVGISIEDLGAQMAFLTTQGYSAANSATYMKSMITTLMNPTANLQSAINELGYDTGETMLNTLGLVGSYQALKEFNNGTFAGLITNQEALQGATALTNDEFAAFNTTFGQTVVGATDAAKAIQDENASWDELRAKLEQASITVGTQLTPVLIALIDEAILPAITAVTDWMQQNPELTQQLVLMAGAAVILGPVISAVGTAVSIVTGLVGLASTAWGVYTTASAAAAAGTATLAQSMLAAAAPIIAIGAAIAGVVYEMGRFSNSVNDAQRYARSELKDEIAEGVVDIKQLQDAAFSATSNQFGQHIPVLGDVIARLTYSNTANAAVGNQQIQGRAIGGGVQAGVPYKVGEDGEEWFVPDSSGEIIPNGGGMGAPVFNIYQQPGESGTVLADRIASVMVQRGMLRAA